MVKIIRKWIDKSGNFMLGTDDNGTLYCKNIAQDINYVCVDPVFKKNRKFYWKFVNPKTKEVKLIERNN